MSPQSAGGGHLAVFLLLLGLLAADATNVTTKVTVATVSSGQQFVDQIVSFGRGGGERQITLGTSISLAGVPWDVEAQSRGFVSGELKVQGRTSREKNGQEDTTTTNHNTVLDTAMRSYLSPPDTVAAVTWEDVIFINLCSRVLTMEFYGMRVPALSSGYVHLMPQGRQLFTPRRQGSTIYITRQEYLTLIHLMILSSTRVPLIREELQRAGWPEFPSFSMDVESMDACVMSIREFKSSAVGIELGMTVRTTDNPDDRWGFSLPEYGGTLMPHRLCAANGTDSGKLLTEAQVKDANFSAFPTWLVSNTEEMQSALQRMSDSGNLKAPGTDVELLPIIVILEDVVVAASNFSGALLASHTLIRGSLTNTRPVLDFQNRGAVLNIGDGSSFFLGHLTLKNLAQRAFNSSYQIISNTTLQLVAVARRQGQDVRLENVTFPVSRLDFLVLLSAAHRGTLWKSGAKTNARLIQEIQEFEPEAFNRSMLVMANYMGWACTGIGITFVPLEPLLDSDELLDQVAPSGGGEGSGSDVDNDVAVGVGVGVGVGGGLLVIGIVTWLLVARSRKRKSRQQPLGGKQVSFNLASVSIVRTSEEEETKQLNKVFKGDSTSYGDRSKDMCTSQHSKGKPARPTTSSSSSGQDPGVDASSSGGLLLATISSPRNAEAEAHGTSLQGTTPTHSDPQDKSPPTSDLQARSPTTSDPQAKDVTHLGSQAKEATHSGPLANRAKSSSSQANSLKLERLNPNDLVRQQASQILKANDTLKLTSICGKGACGTVYKGIWKGLTVAVKTVLFTERTDGSTRLPEKARAIVEAAVSTSLSHPNVVSTYHYEIKPITHNDQEGIQVDNDADTVEDWKLFLILEFCDCTISYAATAGLLHCDTVPMLNRIIQLLLDVAKGTLYLHDNQIIHGDLKPDNVLLKPDPTGRLVAKITDFGLAINLGPTATHASNFRSGTPYYCAPEVALSGWTTKSSDTFSFGVIMSELIGRTPPWLKVDNMFVANPSFPCFPPETPHEYLTLAVSCLEVDMRKRPPFSHIVQVLTELSEKH